MRPATLAATTAWPTSQPARASTRRLHAHGFSPSLDGEESEQDAELVKRYAPSAEIEAMIIRDMETNAAGWPPVSEDRTITLLQRFPPATPGNFPLS